MIEVIGTYFIFLAIYPAAVVMSAAPGELAAWITIGLVVALLLRPLSRPSLSKLWVALWFMPGTIICGAATLLPLPFAVWSLFAPGRCATLESIVICVVLNIALVFATAALWQRFRHGKGAHDKPLHTRDDARSG